MQSRCSKSPTPKCLCAVERRDACHVRLVLIGINYKTSTLEEREPLQLSREDLPRMGNALVSTANVLEAVSIATCNRIEFYLVLRDTVTAFDVVAGAYQSLLGTDITPLREKFYERTDGHAVRHLLRVAAGLNSMVLGETQIFGQIKQGYSVACSVKAGGKILHRLFHQAFRTGKKVREETSIGRGAVSVGGVAVRMLRERLAGNAHPSILFVGVNEMISIAAEHFSKGGYKTFAFANRTLQHARQLAEVYGGESHNLDHLPVLIAAADVLIACTGAATPVITREIIERAQAERQNHDGLLIMDLGVPRDVEPGVGELSGVELLDLDDMHSQTAENLEERATAIGPAEVIVETRLAQFIYWYEAVRLEPMYEGLGGAFEQIRTEELAALMDELPSEHRDTIDQFTIRLARRLLQAACRRSE